MASYREPVDKAVDRKRRRRSMEETPDWVTCRWLNKCAGAELTRAQWLELGMWAAPMYRAFRLPKFGRRYPCDGCLIVTSRREVA
jgi:hypothetical protein